MTYCLVPIGSSLSEPEASHLQNTDLTPALPLTLVPWEFNEVAKVKRFKNGKALCQHGCSRRGKGRHGSHLLYLLHSW